MIIPGDDKLRTAVDNPRQAMPPRYLYPSLAVLLCLLAITLSLVAVSGKSSTFDEPLHTLAAATSRQPYGMLINPEHPPLWKYYASLATGSIDIPLPPQVINQLARNPDTQWFVAWREMYEQPALRDDPLAGERLVSRARIAMSLLLLPVGLLTFHLAQNLLRGHLPPHIAGLAALATAALVVLDPNILAHAPLVTNDLFMVVWSLATAALLLTHCRSGKTLPLLAAALCVGLALCTKFSGIALFVGYLLVLIARFCLARQWRPALIGVVALIVIPFVTIWACYGFRFLPTQDPNIQFELTALASRAALNQQLTDIERQHYRHDSDNPQPSSTTTAILMLNDAKLLPQPYLHGLVTSYALTRHNNSFLLGEIRGSGFSLYFLIAFLCKAPTATIALVVAGAGVAWKLRSKLKTLGQEDLFTILPITILPLVYLIFSVTTPLNIGYRHIFPVLPFVILLAVASIMFSRVIHIHRHLVAVALLAVVSANSLELCTRFPHLLTFFNLPAQAVGPLRLLSDSNLDWGQDLPLLARWREENKNGVLYLAYFGSADPARTYGLDYRNAPGGYELGGATSFPTESDVGFFAVSATVLQGTYGTDRMRSYYDNLRSVEPVAVLGGSIFVYSLPLPNTPNPQSGHERSP